MAVVVLGLTSRPETNAAAARAVMEARAHGAEVVVVHTVTPSEEMDPARDTAEVVELEALEHVLENEGIPHRTRVFRGSAPEEDIVRVAVEEQALLVVIGIRRRSAVGKAVLGSHAHRIIMAAPCPVLTVKAEPA